MQQNRNKPVVFETKSFSSSQNVNMPLKQSSPSNEKVDSGLDTDSESLKNVQHLKREKSNLEREISIKNEKIEVLNEEIENLKEHNKEVKEELKILRESVTSREIEKQLLNESTTITDEEIANLKNNNKVMSEEFQELRKRNLKLQEILFDDDVNKENLGMKTTTTKIGTVNRKTKRVHIGENLWVGKEKWDATILNSNRSSSLFTRNLSRNYFGKDLLIQSTPYGKAANRGPDRTPKKSLDPIALKAIQDSFEHWAKNILYPPMLDAEIMQQKPVIVTYIGKFCNDLRKLEREKSDEGQEKRKKRKRLDPFSPHIEDTSDQWEKD